MKRFTNLLRLIFISPEFLAVVVFMVLWKMDLSIFAAMGDTIKNDDELWKYLLSLPAIFAGVVFTASNKIRAPQDGKSNKELYEWPGYRYLLDGVYVSFSTAIFFFIVNISTLLLRERIDSMSFGILYVSSLIILGICALTVFLAKQKIRELIEQYGRQ